MNSRVTNAKDCQSCKLPVIFLSFSISQPYTHTHTRTPHTHTHTSYTHFIYTFIHQEVMDTESTRKLNEKLETKLQKLNILKNKIILKFFSPADCLQGTKLIILLLLLLLLLSPQWSSAGSVSGQTVSCHRVEEAVGLPQTTRHSHYL